MLIIFWWQSPAIVFLNHLDHNQTKINLNKILALCNNLFASHDGKLFSSGAPDQFDEDLDLKIEKLLEHIPNAKPTLGPDITLTWLSLCREGRKMFVTFDRAGHVVLKIFAPA